MFSESSDGEKRSTPGERWRKERGGSGWVTFWDRDTRHEILGTGCLERRRWEVHQEQSRLMAPSSPVVSQSLPVVHLSHLSTALMERNLSSRG